MSDDRPAPKLESRMLRTKAPLPPPRRPSMVRVLRSRALQNVERLVDYLAVLALVLAAVVAVGRRWPAANDFNAIVGDLVYDICIGYLAAWIFNVLVVVIPSRRRERLALEAANPDLSYIASLAALFNGVILLGTKASISVDSNWNRSVLEAISEDNCPPFYDRSGLLKADATWIDHFDRLSRRSEARYDRILPLLPMMDPRVVAAVAEIRDNFLARPGSERLAKYRGRWADLLVHFESLADAGRRLDLLVGERRRELGLGK